MAGRQSHAPEIPEELARLNTDGPVRLSEQKGKVVLLNFDTYCSLHCLHVNADLDYLAARYPDRLAVIGIHGPRFPAEKHPAHVRNTLSRRRVNHPVIHDPDYRVWQRYGTHAGPTLVVIDTQGELVGSIAGAGNRRKLERIIAALLGRAEETRTARAAPCTVSYAPEPVRPLSFPDKVLATGNRIYIADSGHNRILSTTPQGLILHQYGDGSPGFMDGSAFSSAFNSPQAMVLADDFLYVADTGNHAIRRINVRTDDVVTLAGTGTMGLAPDGDYFGDPRQTELNSPGGLAHKASMLYIAMTGLNQLWSLSLATNTLEIFAGSGEEGLIDGASWNACFARPRALSIIGNTLYVADSGASAVRTVDLTTRQVRTLVGKGLFEYGDVDGIGTGARLQYPLDITADPTRKSLWVADTYNNKIRKIRIDNTLVSSYPVKHPLNEPAGLAFSGNTLYIANTNCHEILCINLHSGTAQTLNVSDKYIAL